MDIKWFPTKSESGQILFHNSITGEIKWSDSDNKVLSPSLEVENQDLAMRTLQHNENSCIQEPLVIHIPQNSLSVHTTHEELHGEEQLNSVHHNSDNDESILQGTPANFKYFKCANCSMVFTAAAFLAKHTKIHHNHSLVNEQQEKQQRCLQNCEGAINKLQQEHKQHYGTGEKQSLQAEHVVSLDEQPVQHKPKCDCCGKVFVDLSVLACHLKMHSHSKNSARRRRKSCGSNATLSSYMCKGSQSHKGELLETQTNKFKCKDCAKIFSSSGSLSNHRRRHSTEKPFKCCYCDKMFFCAGDLTKHVRSHTGDKPFECTNCDKKFALSGNLKKHMSVHSDNKPFKCQLCEKCFKRASHLKSHMHSHSGERPFHCELCDKRFTRESGLVAHNKIHKGEKLFQCEDCSKRFYFKCELVKHKRSHSGEKPYVCDICQKGFSQTGHLNVHRRTHTGEKPFECPTCQKSFASGQQLANHKRLHTGEKPFKCTQCDKQFAQKGNLMNHIRTHSDDRPFKCSQCSFAFKDPSSLAKHKKLHMNIRPYTCRFCGKTFTRRNHMRNHEQAIHKKKTNISFPNL